MTDIARIELDGVSFRLDVRAGAERGTSRDADFVLVKTPGFLEKYSDIAQRRRIRSIVEIGMFEGGSVVYFDKLFRPEALLGVDIRRDSIPALDRYCTDNPHVRTLYATSQDDPALPGRITEHVGDGIDLIVDDASHRYAPTRAAFMNLFPLLAPGGLYIIEDWQWAHQPAHQSPDHPWFDSPALTTLIFELVLATSNSRAIRSVTVHPQMFIIERGDASPQRELGLLRDGNWPLRGRAIPEL